MQPASRFCALPGAFRPSDGGRLFAALIPPLFGFLPTAQHCNVYNFCNLAIFKSAIPRLQNSNTLHCCAVALPVRHCLILSSSQYHVLFIRFARTPNSFFAFSSVRFDMPCSSARPKISLLWMHCLFLPVPGVTVSLVPFYLLWEQCRLRLHQQ